ncbi:MAG: hypothetical protein Q9M48_13335 [Rhodobacterales bacterium]|nr:hypothetical protein [Rhodobacterales bacterium]
MQGLFSPLGLSENENDRIAPRLENEGRALSVPAIDRLPALRLEWKSNGRRLFSVRDMETVSSLTRVLRHSLRSRDAFEDGVLKERTRIARDMHDNIGIQLLGALHARDIPRKDALVREALSDLRDIVANSADPDKPLSETIVELRLEISELLATCDIALDWRLDETVTQPPPPQVSQTLRAVLREAASNVVRHSDATNLRIAITHDSVALRIIIEDNGRGFDSETVKSGNGLRNLAERVETLNGSLEFTRRQPPETGILIRCIIPINPIPNHDEAL